VLNEFKLYERWDLNPNDPEYRYWSNLLYQERVSIGPTRYESVEIVTQDEDPQVAKDMAVFIIDKFNEVTSRGDKEMHIKYRTMKEFEIGRLDSIIDLLEERITTIRIESGITDYESQSERVIEGYLDLLKSGASRSKLEEVEKMIKKLSNQGGEIEVIREKINGLKEYNADLTEEFIMATSRTLSGLDYAKVIVEPRVADKKSYPVRWIIMVISVLLGGLAAVILVIFKERLSPSS
ncbi:MAG: hypothetical protein HKN45_12110, partial [Flavobacteriales bacterium]|nr:hypothetical protein [Flavobacteriales bacterium]